MPLIMLVPNITVFLPYLTASLCLAVPGTVGFWFRHAGLLFSGKLLVTTGDLLVFLIVVVSCYNICWFLGFETLIFSSSFVKSSQFTLFKQRVPKRLLLAMLACSGFCGSVVFLFSVHHLSLFTGWSCFWRRWFLYSFFQRSFQFQDFLFQFMILLFN